MSARVLVTGVSGPSSSGKTTLAHLIRLVFQKPTVILHQDDFYKPEAELPMTSGMRDWDSLASFDIPALHKALAHIRTQNTLPNDHESLQPKDLSLPPIQEHVIARLRGRIPKDLPPLCLVDGILLYPALLADCDVRLFLRASRDQIISRRSGRDGYMTAEGWWKDPEGYVENVVWPGFVREMGWLFRNRDVEGQIDETVAERDQIRVCSEASTGEEIWEALLEWAVDAMVEGWANIKANTSS
ncbi:MAG: ribosylnicotinamide kinase [Piccolia ochrophora]|nr:MAG: ribosylnicotinamide kinase [Piccolia ochrophora]